jgi:hypothetical protein
VHVAAERRLGGERWSARLVVRDGIVHGYSLVNFGKPTDPR